MLMASRSLVFFNSSVLFGRESVRTPANDISVSVFVPFALPVAPLPRIINCKAVRDDSVRRGTRRAGYEFPAENTWHTYRFLSADSALGMEWWYPII